MIGKVTENIVITIQKGSIVDVTPKGQSKEPGYELGVDLTSSVRVLVQNGKRMRVSHRSYLTIHPNQIQILDNLDALVACKIEEDK